jgi:hypothetical protein
MASCSILRSRSRKKLATIDIRNTVIVFKYCSFERVRKALETRMKCKDMYNCISSSSYLSMDVINILYICFGSA